MPRAKKPAVSPEQEAVIGRVLERPDGFYWQEKEGGEEYGPFPTRAEAEADMESDGVAATGSDAVHDAGSELRISQRVDPDSGEAPADPVPGLQGHSRHQQNYS